MRVKLTNEASEVKHNEVTHKFSPLKLRPHSAVVTGNVQLTVMSV
jgi:hypothetical protein